MAEHAHITTRKSPPVTIITRRAIGAATALLALSGTAVARGMEPPHPDAALLAICAEAERADDEMEAVLPALAALRHNDPLCAKLRDKCDEWFDDFCDGLNRAQAVPAKTIDGIRAKARLAIRNAKTRLAEGEDEDFNAAFLRELAGRA